MVQPTGPASADQKEQSKDIKKGKSSKMKSTTTKNDVVDKGKTILGSKPDTININPVIEKAILEIEKIYDKVEEEAVNSAGGGAVRGLGYVSGDPMGNDAAENNYVNANIADADTQDNILKNIRNSLHDAMHNRFAKAAAASPAVKEAIDRSNTFLRDRGTTSLTNIYKHDTPGQTVNDKFRLQFKDPKGDKEAVSRSGNPDRKEMDLVPRNDPDRDRKKDSSFFRQQSIVKRRKDLDEDLNNSFSEAYGKGYKSPWDKIEKAKPGISKRIDTAAAGLKQNADDYQSILDKEKKQKEVKEEHIDEVSKEKLNQFITKSIKKHPTASTAHPIGSDVKSKKAIDLALDKLMPKSAIHKPHVLATEDTTSDNDPVKHLEDKLNTATDKSHNGVDKIMRQVAGDYNMDVHDLHDMWVKKAGCTPDEYVKEDLRQWFKDKWVRMDTRGNIKGDCAREEGEGKPKCLPVAKARAMDKEDRAAAARRKRREDPVADRPGKGGAPINVRTEAANPAQQAAIAISLIKAGKKKGKDPGPQKEEVEHLEEKNKPTNPALWARAKSLAKSKFDVYPSAYANGWAAKWYKSKGGGWKSVSEENINELSNELIGKVNKIRTLSGVKSKTAVASKTLDKAVEKVRNKTEVGKVK